jgi:hypothetical protein
MAALALVTDGGIAVVTRRALARDGTHGGTDVARNAPNGTVPRVLKSARVARLRLG